MHADPDQEDAGIELELPYPAMQQARMAVAGPEPMPDRDDAGGQGGNGPAERIHQPHLMSPDSPGGTKLPGKPDANLT